MIQISLWQHLSSFSSTYEILPKDLLGEDSENSLPRNSLKKKKKAKIVWWKAILVTKIISAFLFPSDLYKLKTACLVDRIMALQRCPCPNPQRLWIYVTWQRGIEIADVIKVVKQLNWRQVTWISHLGSV